MLTSALCLASVALSVPAQDQNVLRSPEARNAPLTAEVGLDDFRISDMGGDGDPAFDGRRPAVAHNTARDEYLVVWEGHDVVLGEFEIWGQLLDADGSEIGTNDFRISTMGPDGDADFDAGLPAVAYEASSDRYLVVWQGDDTTDGELEIWGQLLDAAGTEVGPDDFRISSMGPDGDASYDAQAPAVAATDTGEFLVVWYGDDNAAPFVEGEEEIWGQRLDATGTEIGTDDFRLSDMGPDGDPRFDAGYPDVAFAPLAPPFLQDTYMVVWEGDDVVDDEFEIYIQFLDEDGGLFPFSDFRISNMGPDGDPLFEARRPAVTAPLAGSAFFLIVWAGADTTPGEHEIFGRVLTPILMQRPVFRLSTTGPDGDPSFDAREPDVCRDTMLDRYLVVWEADTSIAGEKEIFAQELDALWREIGSDVRMSDMGAPGDSAFDAWSPAVAFDAVNGERLVVWHGDDDAAGLADGEDEVWGQRDTPVSCDGTAAMANRSVPGNVDSYDPSPVRIGQTFSVAVNNVAVGQQRALLFGYRLQTDIVLSGGQHLLCADDGGGEVFTGNGLAPWSLFSDSFETTVPADTSLCGFTFSSQVLHYGNPPFLLSNARDFTIGN